MPHMTGHMVGAGDQLPVVQIGPADSGADSQEHHLPGSNTSTVAGFAQRVGVHVIDRAHFQSGDRPQFGFHVGAGPAGQGAGGRNHLGSCRIDDPCRSDAHAGWC